MKRKTLSHSDNQAAVFIEYLAFGNEIFVLNHEIDQSKSDDRTLEDFVKLKLGSDIIVKEVEQSQIF